MGNEMVTEVFKEIDGYYGKYSVGNYGRIINNKTGRDVTLNYGQNPPTAVLYMGTKCTSYPIYMLVAKAFVDNPNNYEYVRFIDGDSRHHRADNLEWVESAESE